MCLRQIFGLLSNFVWFATSHLQGQANASDCLMAACSPWVHGTSFNLQAVLRA